MPGMDVLKGRGARAFLLMLLFIVIMAAVGVPARADGPSAEEQAQANNPLASMKTFNLQNYYVPKLTGVPDEVANTFWFRYAQPIGPVLIRASLPLATVPGGEAGGTSGLGDLNVFGAYLAVQQPALSFGVGPLFALPTATEDALGSGKWQAGAAMVAFADPSPNVQLGGLVTWQASFSGDEDREATSVMAVQPVGMWQLGGGTYVRSTGIMAFDLLSGNYNVPFGLGLGKVVKAGPMVFNIFAEPQFTILHKGMGQPALQFLFGLNMQFVSSK